MELNLNSLLIGSDDPKALSDFYTKLLGKATWEEGEFRGWRVGNASLMVGPHSEVKGRNEMPGRVMWNFETADVKKEFKRIKGLGVTVIQEPYHPGAGDGDAQPEMWMATFEDVDGNYFQLNSPMEDPS